MYGLKIGDLAIIGGSADKDLHGTIIRLRKYSSNRYEGDIVQQSPKGRMGLLAGEARNVKPYPVDNEEGIKYLKEVRDYE